VCKGVLLRRLSSWLLQVHTVIQSIIFSERELTRELYTVARPTVCRLSVTLVRRTQEVEIFGNVSTPFGTFAIR